MGLMVGSARSDERGKASGGTPGDQTGREVSTQAYYMHSLGWYCYRPKSTDIANALAAAMLEACGNNNIGYCQGHRANVIAQLKKCGSLAKIATATEADCSSLVRACCMQAGFDPGNFNTESEGSALAKTGCFMDRITVASGTVLYNGDILVTKKKGHTVIVVSGNPRTISWNASRTKVAAAKCFDQTVSGTYSVTASSLNMRAGAGTDQTVLTALKKGDKFQCYGYYTSVNGTKWLYGVHGANVGFVSSKYLQR